MDIYSYRAALHENNLRNTAGRELDLHATMGIVQGSFQSKLLLSNVSGKNGFFANAHGLEPRNVDTDLHDESARDIHYPYQSVNHFKLINTSQYQWEKMELETNLGFQRNFRQERSIYVNHGYLPAAFPDTLDFSPDLERQFDKKVYSGNLRLLLRASEQTRFRLGINSDYQDNRIDGRGFIIPAYRQFMTGVFAIAKHEFDDASLVQFGLRFDQGSIRTEEYHDWFPSPSEAQDESSPRYLQRAKAIHRSFSSLSWSAGYNYSPGKWSFKSNIGKGFRVPIAKELAANGVNYHRFSYERGNPDLSPETSYQLDAGMEYRSARFALGTTPFLNYFSNYIYLNPGWKHGRRYGNGNQVFYYTQSRVFRHGAEIHAHYEPFRSLLLGVIGEYVRSLQLSGEKKGFTLPFSPPPSAIFNIKYQRPEIRFIEQAYFSFDYRITASQDDIVPPEETTSGYQLFNLGLGGELHLQNQKVRVAMQIKNLLNTRHFNHTSYYRLINVPEPGRNFIVNISVPFSGRMNQE